MLEMNFSQIGEVTRGPIGWFDTEWPIQKKVYSTEGIRLAVFEYPQDNFRENYE